VVRAVVFDVYFTLVDPESPDANAAAAALLDGGDHTEVLRVWRTLQQPDVVRALDGEPPAFEVLGKRWRDGGAALFAALGFDHDGSHWETCRAASHASASLFDDVRPAIAALRDASVKVGVLSDADTAWLRACLDRHQLDLDVALCSEELRCYKPHRSVFLAACDALGVEPGDAAYVGDNPRADVVGARNAGMTSVWINRRGRPWPDDLEAPDHELSSLLDLPTALGIAR
jgi:putative hydrolase of the HAD superfamily